MPRAVVGSLVPALLLSVGCKRTPPSADAVKKLSDPSPDVRAAAAQSLRIIAVADAAAVGDVGSG